MAIITDKTKLVNLNPVEFSIFFIFIQVISILPHKFEFMFGNFLNFYIKIQPTEILRLYHFQD